MKQCNEAMLQVYSLVRGTKQGMVYHLADVLKQCNEAMLQVYSLVRGTKEEATWVQGDVRHAGQVVDVFYNLVRGTRTGIYYVEWVEMYLYYNLVRGTMVEATLLWASVERDKLDKKMMMKFFPWWSVAHCARSKSASTLCQQRREEHQPRIL